MADYRITIAGQQQPLELLSQAYKQQQLMPAYLFWGESGVGKTTAALWLAQLINCSGTEPQSPCGQCLSCRKIYATLYPDAPGGRITAEAKASSKSNSENKAPNRIHPDISIIAPVHDEILIDQIREMQEEAKLLPLEARYKVYIIEDAHRLNNYAANCLLKILEEPPAQVMIILTTPSPAALLPTILSRCAAVKFYPLSRKQLQDFLASRIPDADRMQLCLKLAQGKPGKALRILSDSSYEANRTALLKFFNAVRQLTLTEFVEKGEKLELDKDENFEILVSWIRDILALKAQVKPEHLVNYDYAEDLSRLAEELTLWQCYQIGLLIKEFRFDVEKPFNLNKKHLVLHLLASLNAVFEIKEI